MIKSVAYFILYPGCLFSAFLNFFSLPFFFTTANIFRHLMSSPEWMNFICGSSATVMERSACWGNALFIIWESVGSTLLKLHIVEVASVNFIQIANYLAVF